MDVTLWRFLNIAKIFHASRAFFVALCVRVRVRVHDKHGHSHAT